MCVYEWCMCVRVCVCESGACVCRVVHVCV